MHANKNLRAIAAFSIFYGEQFPRSYLGNGTSTFHSIDFPMSDRMTGPGLSILVYASTATDQFDDRRIPDLLARSREKNGDMDVTGVLLYEDGLFLQILEGEADVIEEVVRHDPERSASHRLHRSTQRAYFGARVSRLVDGIPTADTCFGRACRRRRGVLSRALLRSAHVVPARERGFGNGSQHRRLAVMQGTP